MDLRKKCKNKQYANLVIQVCKMNNACKFCVRNQNTCKYHQDHKNCWKSDGEYCFNGVRKWISDRGFNDYYDNMEEIMDDDF